MTTNIIIQYNRMLAAGQQFRETREMLMVAAKGYAILNGLKEPQNDNDIAILVEHAERIRKQ